MNTGGAKRRCFSFLLFYYPCINRLFAFFFFFLHREVLLSIAQYAARHTMNASVSSRQQISVPRVSAGVRRSAARGRTSSVVFRAASTVRHQVDFFSLSLRAHESRIYIPKNLWTPSAHRRLHSHSSSHHAPIHPSLRPSPSLHETSLRSTAPQEAAPRSSSGLRWSSAWTSRA